MLGLRSRGGPLPRPSPSPHPIPDPRPKPEPIPDPRPLPGPGGPRPVPMPELLAAVAAMPDDAPLTLTAREADVVRALTRRAGALEARAVRAYPPEAVLTARECAEWLGVSLRHVETLHVPCFYLGPRIRRYLGGTVVEWMRRKVV